MKLENGLSIFDNKEYATHFSSDTLPSAIDYFIPQTILLNEKIYTTYTYFQNFEDFITALGRDIIVQNAFYSEQIYNHIEYDKVIIHNLEQYIPRFNKFFNGDDLSENVYRVSKGCHMRFGHVNRAITPVTMHPIPNRIQLAHKVAFDCYEEIMGTPPQNWDLAQGQAIQ